MPENLLLQTAQGRKPILAQVRVHFENTKEDDFEVDRERRLFHPE